MLQPNEKRVGELYTDLLYVFNVFAGFIVVYTNCNLAEKGQVDFFFYSLFIWWYWARELVQAEECADLNVDLLCDNW